MQYCHPEFSRVFVFGTLGTFGAAGSTVSFWAGDANRGSRSKGVSMPSPPEHRYVVLMDMLIE
jgi:hypothetical protein